MARLLTNGATDLTGVNWNEIRLGAVPVLETGVNDTVRSLVYRDVLVLEGPAGTLWLWGEGLVADPQGRLIAGSVQAIAQGGTRFDPQWIIQQIDVPATTVWAAVASASRTDDERVLRIALAGNDILRLGDIANDAFGGLGHDTIYSGRGDDTLRGDSGNDIIESFFGNDLIWGGSGDDTIRASADNDTVYGGSGNDHIFATTGANRLSGGTGDDSIVGGTGNDTLRGDDGSDTLVGGAGSDRLMGRNGNDVVSGGSDADRVWGDSGDDTLTGDDGSDQLFGGADQDALFGGRDSDRLDGGSGRDTLDGGDGDDRVDGGVGNDLMRGGAGTDTLFGGLGRDTLAGGTGSDLFVFRPNDGADVIEDFTAGAIVFNDRLALSAALWAPQGRLDAAGVVAGFASLGSDGFVRLTFADAGTTIILTGVTDPSLLVPLIEIL